MATNWLGSLGGTAGQMAGTYYGGPIGGMAGQYVGSLAGNALGDEVGLEDTSGGTVDEWGMPIAGGGGPGGVGFNYDLMSTQDLFDNAGGMLPGIAGYEVAYNQALQPGLTGVQLNAEQQIAPGTFDLRRGSIAARQRDLDLGYRLPPELQDLVLTNALQGLTSSGAGASNLGMLFGARSLAGAGLDRGEARIAAAERASQFRPDYFTPRQPFGSTPGMLVAGDIRGREAAIIDQMNLQQQLADAASQKASQDQSNMFTSLLGQAAGMMGGASGGGGMMSMGGGGASTIGGPNQGIGSATTGGSTGGFDISKIFAGGKWGQPSSVKAEGYPVGSDQYNAIMGGR